VDFISSCLAFPVKIDSGMTLEIPDRLAAQAGCEARDLVFGLVAGLYLEGRLTLGQAADVLGTSRPELLSALGERGLPVSYTADDALSDLAAVERLWGTK
jgi:predicted HTH domain antitoxin